MQLLIASRMAHFALLANSFQSSLLSACVSAGRSALWSYCNILLTHSLVNELNIIYGACLFDIYIEAIINL